MIIKLFMFEANLIQNDCHSQTYRHAHTSVNFMDIKRNFDLVVAEHHS